MKSKSLKERKDYNINRNYCKKLLRNTKKIVQALKKSLIIELFGELLYLFFQIKTRQVIKLSQMWMVKLFQVKKNYAEHSALTL